MAVTESAIPERASGEVVYRVDNLVKLFPIKTGFLGSLFGPEQYVHAVDGVSFDIRAGEMFGRERLESVLRACAGKDAAGIVEALERAIQEFQPEAPRDDIAILVARVQG